MKKYLTFFTIRFTTRLQYRAAAAAGMATQFAWGFMNILMFSAFYRANPAAFPMGFDQLASYIWLRQALLALLSSWSLDSETLEMVSSGNIGYELCRPVDLYNMWFVKDVATRTAAVTLRCIPIFAVSFFLPKPYNLSLPPNAGTLLLFLLSMVLGFCVIVAYSMLVYIATFYTYSPLGVRWIAISLTEFLSGSLLPLNFLPDSIRRVLELLPFSSMQNVPLRVYSGDIAGQAALWHILLQLFWLAVLVALGQVWMKNALKRVVVQGG